MKKIIIILLFAVLGYACNSANNKTENIAYYPISITALVNTQTLFITSNEDSACKTVLFKNSKIEKNKIGFEDVEKDIQSFIEFDINKAAWQNSYSTKTIGNTTKFSALEEKLPLKFIEITGDLKSPSKLRIYFQNTNNLYQSIKVIEWVPNAYYSIFSIQDVKGMDADTLFIKTYLNCN